MTPLERLPYAQPLPVAEPVRGIEPAEDAGHEYTTELPHQPLALADAPTSVPVPRMLDPNRPRTDGMAIGSALMGFFGFVPVVCQVIGVLLGTASLIRIRRARRRGASLAGVKVALIGLTGNVVLLVCWIAILGVMVGLRSVYWHSAETLQALTPLTSG
jgi:hypothetical protein